MSAHEWNHKDLWRRWGRDFMVEVSRHTEPERDGDGPNRWAVYAYIYPKHPHFSAFSGPEMCQDAAAMMPLHYGPSYLRWHRDDSGKPTSVQVGADYQHYRDNHTREATQKDAYRQFADADELFAWLEARAVIAKAEGGAA